jgi:hypothetical protein
MCFNPLKPSQSQSHFTTDGQSVSQSWCRAPFGGPWPDFKHSSWLFRFFVFLWGALSDERVGLSCVRCLIIYRDKNTLIYPWLLHLCHPTINKQNHSFRNFEVCDPVVNAGARLSVVSMILSVVVCRCFGFVPYKYYSLRKFMIFY